MSWDLHPEEMIDKASSLPVTQTPEVGVFHNFMEGAAKVAMQGFAKTARAVDLMGAVGPIVEDWATDVQNRRALGAVPATMPKTVTAQDRYFKEHDAMFQSAVDYWTPRPNEVGVAGEVAGSLLSMLPTIMASPALAVGATQLAQGQDLVREGVDPGKAQAVGAVQALGLGAGIWMPILGTNAFQRMVIGGAGFNVVQGVSTRAASKAILEGDKAAEQFRPLGGTELTLDILLGLAFGTMAHINPAQRAQGAKAWEDIGNFLKDSPPSDKAALATLREAQHINLDSLPGTPQTAADLDVHVQRMRAAIESLATDKPVDVENIVVEQTAPQIQTLEERLDAHAAERTQMAMERQNAWENGPEGMPMPRSTPLEDALATASAAGVADFNTFLRHIKNAIDAGRVDVAQSLVERAERHARNSQSTPGVSEGHPKYEAIKADLEQRKINATEEAEKLRSEFEAAKEAAGIQSDVPTSNQPRYNPDMARIEQDTAIREAIQEHAKTVAAEEGIPQIPDRKTIAQTIEEQLVQAGRPAEEAKAGATLWQAFFDTTASRYGRTGQELFDRYMKGITGQAGEGPMLAQARSPEEWARLDAAYADAVKSGNRRQRQQLVNEAAGIKPMTARLERGDGIHSPSDAESGAPGWDLTGNGIYPEDVYGMNGRRYYGTGDDKMDNAAHSIVMGLEGKPNAPVKVYRAVETDHAGKILPGDWITTVRAYAQEHGRSNMGGNFKIISKTVTAKDIYTSGDSWLEWGYNPQPKSYPRSMAAVADGAEQPPLSKRFGGEQLFQGAVPWYHSELERQIGTAKMGAASPKDWKNYIKGLSNKGVKADEVKWTGLEEWLDLQQGKVTKEQIQQYMKDGGVKVEETTLGAEAPKPYLTNDDGKYQVRLEGGALFGEYSDARDARSAMERAQENAKKSPKFGQWQLPGGENYRELLLTLPTQGKGADLSMIDRINSRLVDKGFDGLTEEQRDVMTRGGNEAMDMLSDIEDRVGIRTKDIQNAMAGGDLDKQFRSSHFDQPNILAHIRFNERTDADGKKVLFIEEIQSDWAQQGKRKGFIEPVDPQRVAAAKAKANAADAERDAAVSLVEKARGDVLFWFEKIGKLQRDPRTAAADLAKAQEEHRAAMATKDRLMRELDDASQKLIEAERELNVATKPSGIPSAPFVGKTEAWVGLALKRMIRFAAENGFDRVALTTGEQQAARYDLRKQVDSIEWSRNQDGTHDVVIMPKGNGAAGTISRGDLNPSQLSDLIGKELAKTIAESKEAGGSLEGLDLKVGGEGMKAFYDRIVPNVANDVLKKLGGGRVGEVALGGKESWVVREKGSPDEIIATMPTQEQAQQFLSESPMKGLEVAQLGGAQPGFDITPSMREKAMETQALFQPERGALQFDQQGKMAIALLKSADPSTFLHESGHFFLEVTNDLASQPDAPAAMKQDMQTLYSWFGLKDADTWNNMTLDEKRPYHEQFARGFERYLRDGQAPTPVLKGLFQRFRDWLKAVYQSASQLNVEVSDQVRAVMDRMLAEPQRTEAPPEATRSATPPPPRGGVGEPMGEASVPEGTVKAFEPKTSDDPQILEMLRDMATNEAGWAQIGGKWMGKAEKGSGVPNFTTWIPKAEWWNDRPDKKMNEAKFVEAVTKHMTDEKMSPAEKRAVDFLTDIANKRLEAKQLYDDAEWNRIAQEVATEGMDPTTKNVVDADAVHIAMQIDEARVERAAITAADAFDFMAEVREIIDGYKPQQDATAAERSTPTAAKPGTPGPAGQEANAPGADRNAGNQGVIAQQALRMVAENPDLPIATGVDAQGNTTYQKASEYLAEAKAMADLRRQDVSLFELAAQCLLGGGR